MYLTKLLMKEFGKFHNKEINLKPGINVIYGESGSGKSTVKDFLMGIIYGIDRKEGISRSRSDYERRRPDDRPGYGGSAYIKKDGSNYLIERSFLAGGKSTSVLDVGSGRELRLERPDTLVGTLVDTGRNTYKDTKIIETQHEDESSQAAAEHLKSYLSNITLTGSASVNKQKAVEYLQDEKEKHLPKPLIRRLDELTEKIEQYDDVDGKIEKIDAQLKELDEEFVIEAEKRKRVARRLVENEDGSVTYQNDDNVDDKINKLTELRESYSSRNGEDAAVAEKFTDKIPVILGAGLLVVFVIAAIVYMLPFEAVLRKFFIIVTALYVVYIIIDGLRIKGYFDSEDDITTPDDEEFKKVLEEIKDENERKEEIEFDTTFAKEYQEKKAELLEKEKVQIDRRNERAKLKSEFNAVFKKKSELEDEIKAIDFAIARINSISDKYKKAAYSGFLLHISDMIPGLTGGKYSEIDFDERANIIVRGVNGDERLERLQRRDIDRISLAVRFAAAKYLAEENLPLVIDGTGEMKNDESRRVLIDYLVRMDEEQIIILTDDMVLPEAFANSGVQTNVIEL
ncbi:MAG: AAA family ATPase [Eubacterium sp.]|jgi:uncharacterized protein YhaN|nr:AAA family ATPase [Eubacterium sp.]